ncbi:MAG: MBL fold metallo-hydrolase [Firmicutes bacterium]|nr:MBL fold metallo-hydrolase [Bacillota bacterium]
MTEPVSPLNPEVFSLFSGSKGNCFFIRAGDDSILVDAGASARATEAALKALGSSLSSVKAVFVTHEHSDHTAGLYVICSKHRIPVHIAAPCADLLRPSRDGRLEKCIVRHPPLYTEKVGCLTIESFITPHDSVLCLGYRICCGSCRLGIATDAGCVTPEMLSMLSGCDGVVIESNHDCEMLKSGPYPYSLKERILSKRGHLSNDDCAEAAAKLAKTGVRRFMLAHLSAENNRPSDALRTVSEALAAAGSPDVRVVVASQNATIELV